MNDLTTLDAYGALIEPDSLEFRRLLPGPIERVWAYLTESDLRRRWLAAGEMDLKAGAEFELVWRNDELTDPPGQRPEGFGDEHRMTGRVIEADPPRRLVHTFGAASEVSYELAPAGDRVLLTVRHHRAPDRGALLSVSTGWHAHLAVLEALLEGRKPAPHWDVFSRLKAEYDRRLPA